jgi:hypothetical protein
MKIMKSQRNPHAYKLAYCLKLFCLLLFCFLAITRLIPQSGVRSDARNTKPDGAISANASLAPPENREPEMVPIPFKLVGLNQRITFGLGTIDEEGDDVRVELIKKPASAKYNEQTLTVDWTPLPKDGHKGAFTVRLTESDPATGKTRRTLLKNFEIAIQPKNADMPKVPPAPLAVETLVTISDQDRLKSANAQWPIIAMFDRIAAIEASKQIKPDAQLDPTTGAALFHDALKNLAILHRNEQIDPDSPRFNKEFSAANWRLSTVRPRVNKRIFELRLVYTNIVAGEPIYFMPRIRIVRAKDTEISEELRQKNNQTFARLFHETFFDGADLKPFVAKDKEEYGKMLAEFITKVMTYYDPADPLMQANFAAMPHDARLGGGNRYDAKGRYLSGDGWAWGVMKVQPVERSGRRVLAFTNPLIDGFTTSIKANSDGTAYRSQPAPRFDSKNKSFSPGWDKLVHDQGMVGIPGEDHDVPAASNIDSAVHSRPHKFKYMVAETSLRDPRRRIFEERGMTCVQCHIRNFDEGDPLNKAVGDPRLGNTFGATRDIPRVPFVIIPTPQEGRSEYMRRVEEEQVGNLTGVMRDYLGIRINIESPLGKEWPHDTRMGKR